MRSTISKLIPLLLTFILFSCAQSEKSSKTSYSRSTLKSFDEIERLEAIERYKKLRSRDWKNYKKTKRYKKFRPKKYVKRRVNKPTPKPVRKKPVLSKSQKEELERELNQNMAYYCMMKRKDKRFSNEADCHAFVENNYFECKRNNGIDISKNLVRCVKKKLR